MKTSKGRYLIKIEYDKNESKIFTIFDTRKWLYRLRGKTVNLNPYVYGKSSECNTNYECTEERALERYKEMYEGKYYD
jgi:hypothetical protein